MFNAGDENRPGVAITFANGCTVSVQWHSGTYSDNKYCPSRKSRTAEVAAWDKQHRDIALAEEGRTELGWQTPAQVLAIMNAIAAREG
jgi:hypothetical protein